MLRIDAPAKINLFLAVQGKRADGFHDVETIFQSITLSDTLELEASPAGIQLACDWPGLTVGPENLCWRAAEMLQKQTGTARGVSIRLYKKIPPGAGLGGGSSDAAATLLGLNRLWKLDLPPEALEKCAAALGSDVPFFLRGGAAIGRGRGERLESIASPALDVVVVWPGSALATPQVYRAWDEAPCRQDIELSQMLRALRANDPRAIAAALRNDLEPAAFAQAGECGAIKEKLLRAGCLGAMLSGSGSALFGVAASPEEARAIGRGLAEEYWIKVARTLPAGESS